MSQAQGLFKATGNVSRQTTRKMYDFYPTPPEATAAFMAAELKHIRAHAPRQVWEPCVGNGAMAEVIRNTGFTVVGSDLQNRWPETEDFIQRDIFDWQARPADAVITNPPYALMSKRNGTAPFLTHLMHLDVPYIAMLLGSQWAYAQNRKWLHDTMPMSRIYNIRWRLQWTKEKNPPQSHNWVVWDRNHIGDTTHHFLDKP
ncbi:MAG: hypothetical protein JJ868_19205 [Shimia sp.]|uniref:hypothetical protein n=1 Tax=Shimia sp. TaxID=1954381 RepID=UPI001B1F80AF|nr:hypothetical protein [Shimia sp.]MBO6899497.1 hypothetical protein [Shimia sp.]